MKALDKKLIRDLSRLRGQIIAIAFTGAFLGTALGLWFGAAVTQNYARFFSFPLLRYEAGTGVVAG
ncbi:MAG: hypothetical protein HC773_10770, partial [Scytonema sp. CRU_2_7]|nr:hypothetical protein [Scytonema sp. CRU_2_7]